MRVLVVGTDDWAIDQAVAALEAAGDVPLRCHDSGQPAFPCHRFSGGRCPVDDGVDVVLTVRGRVTPEPLPGELGVLCGLRGRIPLVVAGFASPNPFSKVTAATVRSDEDLVAVCEAAVRRVIDLRPVAHLDARPVTEPETTGSRTNHGLP